MNSFAIATLIVILCGDVQCEWGIESSQIDALIRSRSYRHTNTCETFNSTKQQLGSLIARTITTLLYKTSTGVCYRLYIIINFLQPNKHKI